MKPIITTEPDTNAFKVRSWRPFQKNTLLGFMSMELPSGLVINDITLHEKSGSRWTAMPARQYELNGEKTWAPVIEFAGKESRAAFQELALSAIDRYLAEESI
jgi:hypothetical protein